MGIYETDRLLDITEKHAYYFPASEFLGRRYGFLKPVKGDDLPITSGMTQRAYREIRDLKEKKVFEGTIIDYLCWTSMLYFFILFKNISIESMDDEAIEKIDAWLTVLGAALISDINNILRLFLKDREYLDKALDAVNLMADAKLLAEVKKYLAGKFDYFIDNVTKLDLTKS